MTRVVISNVYADDNRGGAAITAATIAAVQRAFPDPEVTLIAVGAGADRIAVTHRHTVRAFPDVEILPAPFVAAGRAAGARSVLQSLRSWAQPSHGSSPAIQRIRQADVLISKGGQALSVRSGFSANAGLWLTLAPVVYAERLDVPSAMYSVTVGPYPRRHPSAPVTAVVLRRTRLVMPRDRRSYAEALRLGVPPERLVEMPDSVFSLDAPSPSLGEEVAARVGLSGSRFMSLTLNRPSIEEQPHYFPTLAGLATHLLDAGLVDRIALVLQTHGSTKSDHAISSDFLRYADDARIAFVSDDLAPMELAALYGQGVVTIGGRLHSTILSLVGGTPAFPFARPKPESIFAAIGLAEYIIRVDDPLAGTAARVSKAIEAGEGLRSEIRDRIDALRHRAREVSTTSLRRLLK